MRDPETDRLLTDVRKAVAAARAGGVTVRACIFDATVAAVDETVRAWPSAEGRRTAENACRAVDPPTVKANPQSAAASAVVAPPTNRAARVAAALREHGMVHLGDQVPADEYDCCADAVLAVLGEQADRAAVLRDAADELGRMDYDTDSQDYGYDTYRDAWNGGVMDGAALLRRLAVEAQQPERSDVGTEFVRQVDQPDEAGLAAVEADLAEAQQQPDTEAPADIQVWPLQRVLTEVRCGSEDWSWDEEWADLDAHHAARLAWLETEIRTNGITTPVLIGSDGRLWDGHHRLRIAVRLGIGYVPVEITRPAPVAQQPAAEAWDVPDARPGTTDYTLQQRQAHAEGEHCFCGPECDATEQQPAAADDEETPLLTRVLELFSLSHADLYDGALFWRVDDGHVHLFANVSDVFAWGGADCEPITPDTLPALEQAYADLKAIDADLYLPELYTARQRGERPQGAAYPDDKTKNWRQVSALFDACGPERPLGLGNPKAAPAHKEPRP